MPTGISLSAFSIRQRGRRIPLKDRKKFWGSIALPIVFLAIAAIVIYEMQLKKMPAADAAFPTLAAVLLIISSVPLIMQSCRGTMSREQIALQPFLRMLLVAMVLFLYVFCLKPVGYLISTFVLCNVILLLIGYEKRLFGAVYSLVLTLIVYGIFKLPLGVPLPMGILGLR